MTLMETAQLLGNFGEFVGAIAVVVTLAYLALQIRQNTRSMDENRKAVVAAAQRASAWGHADWNTECAKDEGLAKLTFQSTQPEMPEFDDFAWFRFQLMARSVVQRISDTYIQQRLGFFDEDYAEVALNHLRGLLEFPAWKAFWLDETKSEGVYPKRFIDEVNSRAPTHVGLSRREDIDRPRS
jgi:hypothetical protein